VSFAHSTDLSVSYPTPAAARRIERSIRVEVGEIADDRTTVRLHRNENILVIDIAAADLVALRAAVNSWLRYVTVAERVVDAVENEN